MSDYSKANPASICPSGTRTDTYYNAPWFYGAGAQYVDDQGTAHLDSPEALATAEGSQPARAYADDIDTNEADALFNDGKAAMEVSGPWRLPTCRRLTWTSGWQNSPLWISAKEARRARSWA